MFIWRGEHFSGVCHFFQLKFLTAPKVGISACMLDGDYNRCVRVHLEGFGGNFFSVVLTLWGLCFFASTDLRRASKVWRSECILHDSYWHVSGD